MALATSAAQKKRCKHCGAIVEAASKADLLGHRKLCTALPENIDRVLGNDVTRAGETVKAKAAKKAAPVQPLSSSCRYCGRRLNDPSKPHCEEDCFKTLPSAHRMRLAEGPRFGGNDDNGSASDGVTSADKKLAHLAAKLLPPLAAVKAELAVAADVWDHCPHCGKRVTRSLLRQHVDGGSCIVAATMGRLDRLAALVDVWRKSQEGLTVDEQTLHVARPSAVLERLLAPADAAMMEASRCIAAIDAVVPITALLVRNKPTAGRLAAPSPLMSLTFSQISAIIDQVKVNVSKWAHNVEIQVHAQAPDPESQNDGPSSSVSGRKSAPLPSLRKLAHVPRLENQGRRRASPETLRRLDALSKTRTAEVMGFVTTAAANQPDHPKEPVVERARRFSPETMRLARAVVDGYLTLDEALTSPRKLLPGHLRHAFPDAVNPELRM